MLLNHKKLTKNIGKIKSFPFPPGSQTHQEIIILLAFPPLSAFSFLRDLTWAKVVMGLWGCGVGSFMGIHSLIMVEYVGLEKLVSTLGVCGITNGLCFILVGPLIGECGV